MSAPKQLTQLPALTGFDGTELLYLVQSMVHGRITLDELKAYLDEFPDRLAADVAQTDADLNTIVESGWYRLGTTNANAPAGNWQQSPMQVIRGLATIAQIIIHYGSNTVWVRAGSPPDVGGALTWQPWSQVARLDAAQTWAAAQTFGGGLSPVTLKRTDNTAAVGPYFDLFRESNAAAAGHNLAMVRMAGRDAIGGYAHYADILGVIGDASAGAVDGKLNLRTAVNGTIAARASIQSGITVGNPSGGDQGMGSGNFQSLFVNGDPVPTLNSGHTWSVGQTFSGQAPVTFYWDDDTATAGPIVTIMRHSDSPASNDNIGDLRFRGRNSAGENIIYGQLRGTIVDPTDGSEDSKCVIVTQVGGVLTEVGAFQAGMVIGSPTGGDMGAGTINLQQAPYVQGASLASSHLAGFSRGTWVPALSGGTVAGNIVHAVQEGYYITDGEWVKAFFNIEAYIGAGAAPSGNLLVSLPFTAAEAAWVSAGVVHRANNATVGQHFTGWGVRRHSTTAGLFTVQNGTSGDINNADPSVVLSSSSGSPTRLLGCIEYIR